MKGSTARQHFLLYYCIFTKRICVKQARAPARVLPAALRKLLIQEYEFLTLETASPLDTFEAFLFSGDVIIRCQWPRNCKERQTYDVYVNKAADIS